MQPLIKRWAAERKNPGTLAAHVRKLYKLRSIPEQVIQEIKAFFLLESLAECRTKTEVAQRCGIHPNTVVNKCKEMGIDDAEWQQIRELRG